MLYIDFDGVILDTEDILFENWRKIPNHKQLSEELKIKYVANANWEYILKHSEPINDSIYYLKQMDPKETFILTKVHSLTNEASSKVKWIRENGIKQNVIIVPYNLKKTDVVGAVKNKVLIDDCLKNLDEWQQLGGIPIFFDMDDDGYDSWEKPNINNYQKVLSLKNITNKYK